MDKNHASLDLYLQTKYLLNKLLIQDQLNKFYNKEYI
jgi:hypothetical protein